MPKNKEYFNNWLKIILPKIRHIIRPASMMPAEKPSSNPSSEPSPSLSGVASYMIPSQSPSTQLSKKPSSAPGSSPSEVPSSELDPVFWPVVVVAVAAAARLLSKRVWQWGVVVVLAVELELVVVGAADSGLTWAAARKPAKNMARNCSCLSSADDCLLLLLLSSSTILCKQHR